MKKFWLFALGEWQIATLVLIAQSTGTWGVMVQYDAESDLHSPQSAYWIPPVPDSLGNVFITGWQRNRMVCRLTETGNLRWCRRISPASSYTYFIVPDHQGNVYVWLVHGSAFLYPSILKLDSTGNADPMRYLDYYTGNLDHWAGVHYIGTDGGRTRFLVAFGGSGSLSPWPSTTVNFGIVVPEDTVLRIRIFREFLMASNNVYGVAPPGRVFFLRVAPDRYLALSAGPTFPDEDRLYALLLDTNLNPLWGNRYQYSLPFDAFTSYLYLNNAFFVEDTLFLELYGVYYVNGYPHKVQGFAKTTLAELMNGAPLRVFVRGPWNACFWYFTRPHTLLPLRGDKIVYGTTTMQVYKISLSTLDWNTFVFDTVHRLIGGGSAGYRVGRVITLNHAPHDPYTFYALTFIDSLGLSLRPALLRLNYAYQYDCNKLLGFRDTTMVPPCQIVDTMLLVPIGMDTSAYADLTVPIRVMPAASYTLVATGQGINLMNPPPQIHYTIDTPLCTHSADGAITLNVQGAGPFHYLWSTGDTSATLTSIDSGVYQVTVTDTTGCAATATIFVPAPPLLTVHITGQYGSNTLTAISQGGTPPHTYLWSTGAVSASITVSQSGTYWVEVQDDHLCTARDTISVLVSDNPPTGITDAFIAQATQFPCQLRQSDTRWEVSCARSGRVRLISAGTGQVLATCIVQPRRTCHLRVPPTRATYLLEWLGRTGERSVWKVGRGVGD